MLLAVEVGNSNTTFGLFATSGELTTAYRLSTERERMPDEWFAMLAALLASDGHDLSEVDGVIISSVVPSVTTWLVDMTRTRLRIDPVIVTGDLDVGLDLDVDEPRQLGADRIVDCVAAFHRYGGPGHHCRPWHRDDVRRYRPQWRVQGRSHRRRRRHLAAGTGRQCRAAVQR